MKQAFLKIAGMTVELRAIDGASLPGLPASYAPFLTDSTGEEPVARLVIVESGERRAERGRAVACGINDVGEARLYEHEGRYSVDLSPRPGAGFRTMMMNKDFTEGMLTLPKGDEYAMYSMDSMLRILYSQAVVAHNAFMLHSAAVVYKGEAVVLMGKSGTGKSTHARLWLAEMEGSRLLNDDNPVVRVGADGEVRVYGSPWSGKTPCYRQASAPVRAFVRLEQAKRNEYKPLSQVDAFVAILPGVSVITHSKRLYERVCSTVIEAATHTQVGVLRCLPDAEAAYELCKSINQRI